MRHNEEVQKIELPGLVVCTGLKQAVRGPSPLTGPVVGGPHAVSPVHAVLGGTLETGDVALPSAYRGIGGETVPTLEKGKYADIISVRGRPDENIRDLSKVKFVMVGGKIYSGLSFR
jgi:hypothetical protein